MSESGRGGVLAATTLPATTGAGLMLANTAHPAVVAGIFAVSVASLVVAVGYLVRYVLNKRK